MIYYYFQLLIISLKNIKFMQKLNIKNDKLRKISKGFSFLTNYSCYFINFDISIRLIVQNPLIICYYEKNIIKEK